MYILYIYIYHMYVCIVLYTHALTSRAKKLVDKFAKIDKLVASFNKWQFGVLINCLQKCAKYEVLRIK